MSDQPTTVAGVLETQARDLGEKPFLHFEDRSVSFAELDRRVNRAANGLAALGVKPGVAVSILLPNSPEWLFVYFATQKLGACAVPVNVALKGEGLRHVLDHSDSSVLVCHPDHAEAIRALDGSLPKLRATVVDTTGAPAGWDRPEGWLGLESVMAASDRSPGVEVDPEAISALMYTSGTTGAPKGVVSRYGSTNLVGIRALGALLTPDEVLYTCLPLFHANALFLSTLRALVLGLPLALSRRFSASRFWDEIRRHGVTTFNALGAMLPILMKQPERPDDGDNPVRVVFSAACPASVWGPFEERFGVRIIEAYAAVDGGGFIVINAGNAPKGSFGKPTNPVRVVDDEGAQVAVGETGELLFQVDDAKRRKVEYYKNEQASDAKIRDGWLHTGDLVHADAEGNLYFDAPPRREHLVVGGGARDQRPPGGAGVRCLRRSVGAGGGRGDGGGGPQAGSLAHARAADRALPGAHGPLHAAALPGASRRAAEDGHPPGPEEPAQARGRGPEHLGPRARLARDPPSKRGSARSDAERREVREPAASPPVGPARLD
jgi:crotonobetaine/carnitine-CoA ligase